MRRSMKREQLGPHLWLYTSTMKRRPMRRRGLAGDVKRADALAAKIVHARARCACADLGGCEGRLEQHHERRRGRGFRWRTESHLLLCEFHHRIGKPSPHSTPAAWRAWMEQHHPEIIAMTNVPETAREAIARLEAICARTR